MSDETVERYHAFWRAGRAGFPTFEESIQEVLTAALCSPNFLYMAEPETDGDEIVAADDWVLASRLSFFLWSSIPDEPLLAAAEQGRLSDPAELERQVRRMLADPRSETLAANFASHWLRLQNLRDAHPDVFLFPDWDENLNRSMRRETELFFDSIVREDRPLLDLLTADYTFVDQRLATHFGVSDIVGSVSYTHLAPAPSGPVGMSAGCGCV